MTKTVNTPGNLDSATSTNAIFTELYNIVRPALKSYVEDLIKHDRKVIEANPGTPFIYGYRPGGTGIVRLLPDLKAYNDEGLKVGERYLFGTIYNEDQLISILKNLKCSVSYSGAGNEKFLYFDGVKLRTATREKCEQLHDSHIARILQNEAARLKALRTQYN